MMLSAEVFVVFLGQVNDEGCGSYRHDVAVAKSGPVSVAENLLS